MSIITGHEFRAANLGDQVPQDQMTPETYRDLRGTINEVGLPDLWGRLWQQLDFTWAGLARAEWGAGDEAPVEHSIKRWRAPADFPVESEILGEGAYAWRAANLQDYWRWVPHEGVAIGPSIKWKDGYLASERELRSVGALLDGGGGLRHLAFVDPKRLTDASWDVLKRHEAWWRRYIDGRLYLAKQSDSKSQAQSNPALISLKLSHGGEMARIGPQSALVLTGVRNTDFYQELVNILRLTAGANQRVSLISDYAFIESLDLAGLLFANGARFENAFFEKTVQFDGANFGEGASFRNATFGGGATFRGAHFATGIDFRGALFGESTSFGACHFKDVAAFEGATFVGECSFRDATFHGPIDFSDVAFQNSARFIAANFADEVVFTHAEFSRGAAFRAARFEKRAVFGGTGNRPGAIFRKKVSFRTSQFLDYADFSNVIWPSNVRDHHGSFEGSRFIGTVDFKTKDFSSFSMFDGADFRGRVLLAEPVKPEISAEALLEKALRQAEEAVEDDYAMTQRRSRGDRPTPASEMGRDARFGALAGGLRTLRSAMSLQKDIVREHRFNRFELKARMRMPSERLALKTAAILYGVLADFGGSIGRPLLSAVLTILIFAAIYFSIGAVAVGNQEGFGLNQIMAQGPVAVSVALDRALPLGLFADTARTWFGFLDSMLDPSSVVFVKLLASLETVIFCGLMFLVGLALRRRFQVR